MMKHEGIPTVAVSVHKESAPISEPTCLMCRGSEGPTRYEMSTNHLAECLRALQFLLKRHALERFRQIQKTRCLEQAEPSSQPAGLQLPLQKKGRYFFLNEKKKYWYSNAASCIVLQHGPCFDVKNGTQPKVLEKSSQKFFIF